MNKKIYSIVMPLMATALILNSCNKTAPVEVPAEVSVPVTVTSIDTTAIDNYVDLNATTAYLIKNTIKANTTGYLEIVNAASNDFVRKNQLLFSLKTREAKVLGNTINKIDSNLHFGGALNLRATCDGFVTSVNVQKGDYVQEGDALAVINDAASFSIVLSLPYELKRYVKPNELLDVSLPDGTTIKTKVEKYIPTVDPASQTQNVILKTLQNSNIPESLIVKVRINKTAANKTISLPKGAVLSDETQTDFWIMKVVGKNMAVKVSIKKGIESFDKVEILSPKLKPDDKILLTGNYGVGDTIKIKITNK
ncbi:efflux RND transporter periplasmic adaptor subunit [Flavobacterium pectinovorum]|uniref:HlyD family efflux transporter periplasmic adaptor subunit n=1 Tax=Flavobacterium pectinovorum TaxID=29533 RepID=A0A502F594_9FLAO|nr:efflux RND transporter periplasmic adaptor subunit [Flavobacterium pectinovorum]TPG44119.1 HlyD family efflux transporter periplasmic adaptor subunit [Flavobacterium pectinovorum]